MAIQKAVILKAAELLLQAAPESTVILFGSYARGEFSEDSDLDFLVIEPEVVSRFEEAIRLRDILRPLRIPVDVLVTTLDAYAKWSDTPGTLAYEAKQEGHVFHALS
ncbi:MAG: nucleotidyltransferase domain-containing protein [Candidatus Sumerlaeota bacterium]|nr:nucleotidyltransferase domain-containing protein [Candidatus Sumerlaeota bacterium]